jgi:peptidoglycan/LPS O-acetylase OafA/YrhL
MQFMQLVSFQHGSTGRFAPDLPGRIPSLDGLRALSIGLVISGHSVAGVPRLQGLVGHLGNYGVRIFLVISGFLITTLLLKEVDKTGRFSLKNFYIRRSLRIFPAFYAYAAAVAALSWGGILVLERGDLLHALTYSMNYHMRRAWWLNHTWSLSVEEQFYLLWPAVLLFAGRRRALQTAVFVIAAVPVIRTIMYFGFQASPAALARNFQAVADALACGCVLAGTYNWMGRQPRYTSLAQRPWWSAFSLGLIVGPVALFKIWAPLFYLIGQSIANLGVFLLIDRCVRYPDNLTGAVLNWRPLALIGTWSYSIYLWQELFLEDETGGFDLHFPLNVIATFVVSILSYYLVEQTFLRMKGRFSSTSARANPAASHIKVSG